MTRTPAQWLQHLEECLEIRRLNLQDYEDYYNGDHRLAFATSKFRETFGDLFSAFASNWCRLICDIPVDRLKIDGFDFGDKDLNADAWRLWEDNDLEALALAAHTQAVKSGEAYILVDPGNGDPQVTIEHPFQMIVEMPPRTPAYASRR